MTFEEVPVNFLPGTKTRCCLRTQNASYVHGVSCKLNLLLDTVCHPIAESIKLRHKVEASTVFLLRQELNQTYRTCFMRTRRLERNEFRPNGPIGWMGLVMGRGKVGRCAQGDPNFEAGTSLLDLQWASRPPVFRLFSGTFHKVRSPFLRVVPLTKPYVHPCELLYCPT